MSFDKIIYTGRTHTTGGREGGASRSDDGRLDIKVSPPGGPGKGTNPEQLFAAGWSTCYFSAIKIVAAKRKIRLSDDASVDAEVDLGQRGAAYGLAARLRVSLPGVAPDVAQELADAAHQICPYSLVTRGNMDVEITVVPDRNPVAA